MRKTRLIDIHSKKSKTKRGALVLIVILGFLLIASWTAYNWYLDGISVSYNGPVSFTISQGESIDSIISTLKELDLIQNELAYKMYLKIHKYDSMIKSGEYTFDEGIQNTDELTQWLLQGQEKVYSYTVPEGWTINQIAVMLFEEKLIEDPIEFMDLSKYNGGWFKFRFQEEVQQTDTLEGYLYPETYFVTKPDSKKIIEQMLRQYDSMIEDEYLSRAEEIGMSWNEVMILSSIVEKEAAGPTEMDIVSSVFHNRLRDGWLLQSCAALEYAVPREGYVFSTEELKTDTPYNTYMYAGLPPTPVCNPSIDAIKATLYPATTDYFYFVAKGDGTHAFSKNLTEHNRNVQKYIH